MTVKHKKNSFTDITAYTPVYLHYTIHFCAFYILAMHYCSHLDYFSKYFYFHNNK